MRKDSDIPAEAGSVCHGGATEEAKVLTGARDISKESKDGSAPERLLEADDLPHAEGSIKTADSGGQAFKPKPNSDA